MNEQTKDTRQPIQVLVTAAEAWTRHREQSDLPTHDTESCLVYAERAFISGFDAATCLLEHRVKELEEKNAILRGRLADALW